MPGPGFAYKRVRLPFVRVLITLNPARVIFNTPALALRQGPHPLHQLLVIFYTPALHNAMIYFTTFIFTLLSYIVRAVPAWGDVDSPPGLYDTYDDEQLVFVSYKVTWDAKYDNPKGNTSSVACSNVPDGFASKYPHFKNIPGFPYIGGAFDIKWGSPNCGKCWKLTRQKTGKSIYFIAIDAAASGFNIGKHAFLALNSATVGTDTLQVEAVSVPPHFCGFKS